MLRTLGDSSWVGDTHGSGEPRIIALHGWGRSGRDFDQVLAGMDALALHLPGFGSAAPPPEAWSTTDYADHLARALGDRGPVVLVGHSFGGRVALRLAAAHPDRVSALVLSGVPLTKSGPSTTPPLAFRVAKAARAAGMLSEARMDHYRNRYGSVDYRQAHGVMRGVLVKAVGEDYLGDATKVQAPVTLVWGEDDQPAPLAGAKQSLDFFPNASLRVVPGASHLLEGNLVKELSLAISEALSP